MSISRDTLTLGIAVLGAALGVINTWNSLRSSRVRLRVTPKWALTPDWTGLSIDVVNLSSFPVTITEVGFTLGRSLSRLPRRVPIPHHSVVHGPALPVVLQPRDLLDVVFSCEWVGSLRIHSAYALTASGEIARGNSGALRQFRARGHKSLG